VNLQHQAYPRTWHYFLFLFFYQHCLNNNTSGFTGVFWDKARNKWKANININGRLKHLGLFTDMDDAIIARKRANVEFGYHANHGAIN
jgi:hypothetical protein